MALYLLIVFLCFLLLPKHTAFYRYSLGVLFAIDCFLNVALLLGDYRETISSRIGKAYERGVKWIIPFMLLIDLVFLILAREKHHCYNAIQLGVGDKTILRW